MDIFKNLDIFSIEKMHLTFQKLNISSQLFKALTHKLHTIVTEVRIFVLIDLWWVKDKDRSDGFVLFDLPDKRCVINESKVPVEKK